MGLSNSTFFDAKVSSIAMSLGIVRKGPSDHEYEVNLPLAYFLVKQVNKNSHLLMCRNGPLPMPRVVQNCSLALERVKMWLEYYKCDTIVDEQEQYYLQITLCFSASSS